jgi:hypothetical protein
MVGNDSWHVASPHYGMSALLLDGTQGVSSSIMVAVHGAVKLELMGQQNLTKKTQVYHIKNCHRSLQLESNTSYIDRPLHLRKLEHVRFIHKISQLGAKNNQFPHNRT